KRHGGRARCSERVHHEVVEEVGDAGAAHAKEEHGADRCQAQVGRANGGRGDGERERRGQGELPEPDLQGAHAAEAATLKERGDRVTRSGGGDGQRADRGGPQRLADEAEPERDGAEDRSGEHQCCWAHVAYGELDEEERGAPDQGERAEGEIAASHRTIMRSRYVTLLFPLPLAGRVGWGLLGERLGAVAG